MSEERRALEGVKVLSFGAFVAGNTAAKLLAEMGADVVKIEPRSRPEVLRTPAYAIGQSATEPSGVPNTVMYATLSRGVRNLSMDLQVAEARATFKRLVSEAEILIENFAGDTLGRWGCAYEDLLPHNPRLVMLSLSGYGRRGPRAGYLAYASTICSYLGLGSAWGYTHGTLTDYVTAATGAVAAVAALHRARHTGEPAYVDLAQIDAMAPTLAELYAAPTKLGQEHVAGPNHVPGSWLSGIVQCQGFDAWLAYEIENDDDWERLCGLLQRPDLRARTPEASAGLQADMTAALHEWASPHTPFTAMKVMQKAGLAAAVVQTSEDVWRDPQLNVRRFGEVVAQPDLGEVTYPASAQRWTKTPGAFRVAPARLGQHTREVLREWIQIEDDDLKVLEARGAIFDAG